MNLGCSFAALNLACRPNMIIRVHVAPETCSVSARANVTGQLIHEVLAPETLLQEEKTSHC